MRGRHEVRDGSRVVRFEGSLLAEASSRWGDSPRWTELALYRTAAGTYVLAGVGRSVLPGETDRTWTKQADGPDGAIELLHITDESGVRFMTKHARRVAEAAAAADDDFREAWEVEVIE